MISGKIILKSATKLTLDQRFGDIAKQTPPATPPRIQQQANVIIPYSRKELFGGNKRPLALNIAQRLKKRSINYRLGLNPNANLNRPYVTPNRPRVFQRLGFPNRRRGGMGNVGGGANSYLFGGQSGLGVRLRGQGRIGGTRTFRSRTRGYLNNNAVSRFSGYSSRGNRLKYNNNNNNNNRGRRGGNNNRGNNNNFNRSNRGRGGPNTNNRGGRGNRRMNNNNNNNRNVTKEVLDNDLDKYMSNAKLDPETNEMDAV